MTEILARQNDYKITKEHSPLYRFMRIQMDNITASEFLLDNTSQELKWKLPANAVYNLARSYISYNLAIAAQGAGNYVWTHEDAFTLGQDISFGTAGGINLCDLKFASNYTKVARKIDTKFEDFMTHDEVEQLYPSDSLASANYVPAVKDQVASRDYVEPLYCANYGANTAASTFINYPLRGFSNTILALDKDIYFGNEMFLRINSNPLNRMAWVTPSTSDTDTSASAVPAAAGTKISKLYLYLAVEQNQLLADSVRAKFDAGNFKLNIPYTMGMSQGTTVVGPANINVQITKQYGKRLLQVLYTAFNSSNTLNTAYDCDNDDGAKIKLYRTALDSQYLQDYQMSCKASSGNTLNNDDWYQINKKFCKDTVILDKFVYKTNWFHLDRFYQKNDDISEENLDVGLELSNQTMNYIIESETAVSGLTHYAFATFRKTVLCTKDGVFFDLENVGTKLV